MNILILGGTGFLGTNVVEMCLENGHDVSIFSRGQTEDRLDQRVKRLYGDRNDNIETLSAANECWDVCIDMSGYTAKQVRESTKTLKGKVRHYVYVSAVRTFLPQPEGMITETSAKHPPIDESITRIDNETYGQLKVTCELIVNEAFGECCTVLRPQVIVGENDLSGRMAYWLSRIDNELVMLPGDGEDYLQVVDVKDVSRFILHAIENRVLGDFNVSGPRVSWRAFVDLLGIKNGVWVTTKVLESANLSFRELPLFRPAGSKEASFMNISNTKAINNGFVVSDIHTTMQRLKHGFEASVSDIPEDIQRELLTPEKEAEIIKNQ